MLLFKLRKVTRTSVQSQIDNFILLTELDKMVQEKENKSVEQSDGFLKFVSESRDWAFEYIEEVQQAIEEYRKIADVIPISKDITVEQAEKLSAAYDKIVSFLPEENLL